MGWTMVILSRRTLTTLPGRTPSFAVRSMTTRVVSTKTTNPRWGTGTVAPSVREDDDDAGPRGVDSVGATLSTL